MTNTDWTSNVKAVELISIIRTRASLASLPPCVEETFLEEGPLCNTKEPCRKRIYGVPLSSNCETIASLLRKLAKIDFELAERVAHSVRTNKYVHANRSCEDYDTTWILPDGSLFREEFLRSYGQFVGYPHWGISNRPYLINVKD